MQGRVHLGRWSRVAMSGGPLGTGGAPHLCGWDQIQSSSGQCYQTNSLQKWTAVFLFPRRTDEFKSPLTSNPSDTARPWLSSVTKGLFSRETTRGKRRRSADYQSRSLSSGSVSRLASGRAPRPAVSPSSAQTPPPLSTAWWSSSMGARDGRLMKMAWFIKQPRPGFGTCFETHSCQFSRILLGNKARFARLIKRIFAFLCTRHHMHRLYCLVAGCGFLSMSAWIL